MLSISVCFFRLAHLGVPYERHEVDVVDRSNRAQLLNGKSPAAASPDARAGRRQPARAIAVVRFLVAYAKTAERHRELVEQRMKQGERALAAMERHLQGRTFLVGESITLADIALYAYTHVADEGGFSLEPYPAVVAWLERVASEPGHVPMSA